MKFSTVHTISLTEKRSKLSHIDNFLVLRPKAKTNFSLFLTVFWLVACCINRSVMFFSCFSSSLSLTHQADLQNSAFDIAYSKIVQFCKKTAKKLTPYFILQKVPIWLNNGKVDNTIKSRKFEKSVKLVVRQVIFLNFQKCSVNISFCS